MSDYDGSEDDSSDYDDPDLLGSTIIPKSIKKYDFDDDENDKSDDDIEEPLFKRLENLQRKSNERALISSTNFAVKKRKLNNENDKFSKQKETKESKAEIELKKRTKHMPATMRSNKPVSRLRLPDDLGPKTFRDPRFSDISGKLDEHKFHQSYQFLDQYQEREVESIEKALKQAKNPEVAAELKHKLKSSKQELVSRRRNDKLNGRLSEIKAQEREKVKQGKKPFFLKRSAIKEIALEERYDELKKEGKLSSFLEKKRKKNSSKDRRSLPFIKSSSRKDEGDN